VSDNEKRTAAARALAHADQTFAAHAQMGAQLATFFKTTFDELAHTTPTLSQAERLHVALELTKAMTMSLMHGIFNRPPEKKE
jgi:hypothetical protein